MVARTTKNVYTMLQWDANERMVFCQRFKASMKKFLILSITNHPYVRRMRNRNILSLTFHWWMSAMYTQSIQTCLTEVAEWSEMIHYCQYMYSMYCLYYEFYWTWDFFLLKWKLLLDIKREWNFINIT